MFEAQINAKNDARTIFGQTRVKILIKIIKNVHAYIYIYRNARRTFPVIPTKRGWKRFE